MANVPKNKKPKILFLPAYYPSEVNLIEGTFIKEYAKAASLYNEVVVLCAYLDPSLRFKKLYNMSEELEEGIRTIRVKYGGIIFYLKKLLTGTSGSDIVSQNHFKNNKSFLPYKILKVPGEIIRDFLWYWVIYSTFRELIKKGWKPDIIHAHVFTAGVSAVILQKVFGVPVVITEHSTRVLHHKLKLIDRLKFRFAYKGAKAILPVSESLEKAIKRYGIKNNFKVVPNVVNTKIFHPSSRQNKNNKKIILLVGFIKPQKGILYLLKALSRLYQTRQDFVLDIVGDGPKRKEYEELTKKLGLDEAVLFRGLKPKEEVAKFMRKANFLVLPSLYETFSVVCVEAMACGKPILATNLPVFKEKINKERGILVPPKNVNALAKSINYMLDYHHQYSPKKISQYVRKNFSHESVGKTLTDIYQKVIEQT